MRVPRVCLRIEDDPRMYQVTSKYEMNMAANPKKIRKPRLSVIAVTSTEEANAGSSFSAFMLNGINVPTITAMMMFARTARKMMTPRYAVPFHRYTPSPTTAPTASPKMIPVTICLLSGLHASRIETSPSAIALTFIARLCVPTFPPILATID